MDLKEVVFDVGIDKAVLSYDIDNSIIDPFLYNGFPTPDHTYIRSDRYYDYVYQYISSRYAVLKYGKKNENLGNPDVVIELLSAACKDLDIDMSVFPFGPPLMPNNFGLPEYSELIYNERMRRLDVHIDVCISMAELFGGAVPEVSGLYRTDDDVRRRYENGNRVINSYTVGKATNFQLNVYDKRLQLGLFPSVYGYKQLLRLGERPLTRFEFRLGKMYLRKIKPKGGFSHYHYCLGNYKSLVAKRFMAERYPIRFLNSDTANVIVDKVLSGIELWDKEPAFDKIEYIKAEEALVGAVISNIVRRSARAMLSADILGGVLSELKLGTFSVGRLKDMALDQYREYDYEEREKLRKYYRNTFAHRLKPSDFYGSD